MNANHTLGREQLRRLRSLRSARARLERSMGPTRHRRDSLRKRIALASKGDVGSALAVALSTGARRRHQELVEDIRRLEAGDSAVHPSRSITHTEE